jgi:hypothetical protein
VGLDRLAPNGGSSATGDPTLDIDPSRDGIEPDVAFTGANDTVAWVVWYEVGSSHLGLRDNDQVFAAKIVADPKADGGFHWRAVGNGTAGQVNTLDTTGANGFGNCSASTSAEDACSLNKLAGNDAEDPRVAAGSLTPGGTTVPWVTWSEDVGGHHAIFVSRLVGGDHFELFNNGNPVSTPGIDSATPDITFFGNTPYVSWTETRGDERRGFVGHFDATGAFVADTPGGIRLNPFRGGPAPLIDARVPLSSSCTADPFSADGTACTPGDVNAPFYTFTTAGSPQRLFAQSAIGGPNCVIFAACRVQVPIHHHIAHIVARLRLRSTVGILVERVHGHRVTRVGRVPLGTHHKGAIRLRWDLRVNGRRLGHGRYRITLRALDSHRNVLGVTKPVTIRVR